MIPLRLRQDPPSKDYRNILNRPNVQSWRVVDDATGKTYLRMIGGPGTLFLLPEAAKQMEAHYQHLEHSLTLVIGCDEPEPVSGSVEVECRCGMCVTDEVTP